MAEHPYQRPLWVQPRLLLQQCLQGTNTLSSKYTQDRVLSLAIGTAATAANRFVSILPIGGSDTIVLDTGVVLNAGETIQGLSDTASKVNIVLLGWHKQTA